MTTTYQATSADGSRPNLNVVDVPDECPQCHNKGTFPPNYLYYNSTVAGDRQLEIVYRCPNSRCYEVFIGYYKRDLGGNYELNRVEPKKYVARVFSEIIKEISSDFGVIYNQALKAEDDGLNQICGPGYRKALEFVIKDYLISKETDEPKIETIKNELLGNCIASRIKDANIKEVAKRAAWLGNDETHYIRKWEEKDLQDLKKLIDLTVHWMEAEALTAQLIQDMPSK